MIPSISLLSWSPEVEKPQRKSVKPQWPGSHEPQNVIYSGGMVSWCRLHNPWVLWPKSSRFGRWVEKGKEKEKICITNPQDLAKPWKCLQERNTVDGVSEDKINIVSFCPCSPFALLMDEDGGLNIRNWGYYEPSLKGHLGLQHMSTITERDTKSLLSGRNSAIMVSSNGAFHHWDCGVSESSVHMEYMKDSWINQRDKFLHVFPGNPNFAVHSEASGAHAMQILQSPDSSKDERVAQIEEASSKRDDVPLKKRPGGRAQKSPKTKKTKRILGVPKDESKSSVQRAKSGKKNMGVVINGIDMDFSGIPIPVCSCTGTPQQCYRWGCGGWQSACCTTSVSIYPLPTSTKRRGARIAGRKMSQGAFKKVLEKLAAEGYSLSNPIDLRTHWAKHGTNKFVTIR
ncbi:hypothetical protein HHK36_006679 [Tetracentron sinense]|uniref:GAGA-binding transcriptional activator n=1 Tax=Tetracentron sinense TaxID=13715 RepID=A0A834ZLD2_TETSI|nr:hypothetical protein HHK36_006679 [Tetracentron sinense]